MDAAQTLTRVVRQLEPASHCLYLDSLDPTLKHERAEIKTAGGRARAVPLTRHEHDARAVSTERAHNSPAFVRCVTPPIRTRTNTHARARAHTHTHTHTHRWCTLVSLTRPLFTSKPCRSWLTTVSQTSVACAWQGPTITKNSIFTRAHGRRRVARNNHH